MSRIQIIRDAVEQEGGKVSIYYADNSNSRNPRIGDALYKIPRWQDGLTPERRQRVVDQLNQHPDVKNAYLSARRVDRSLLSAGYSGVITEGGHLKVRFYGLARPW